VPTFENHPQDQQEFMVKMCVKDAKTQKYNLLKSGALSQKLFKNSIALL
jgi:hypothetical protein